MSAVARFTCSRVLMAARQPAKMSVRAAAPIARAVKPSTQFGGAISLKTSMFSQTRQFNMFHCSAMADATFDSESSEGAAPGFAQAEAPPNRKLYCGNISWDVVDEDLRGAFEAYGNVESAQVVLDPNGRSRGFAFVEMTSVEEAQAAIDSLNNSVFVGGRDMRVDFHQVRDPNYVRPQRNNDRFASEHRLYVGNLPWSFDDFDLQDCFEVYGKVVDAKVIMDRETGRSRGFGFVTMSSDEEVESAIREMDGSTCDGRSIRVNKANS